MSNERRTELVRCSPRDLDAMRQADIAGLAFVAVTTTVNHKHPDELPLVRIVALAVLHDVAALALTVFMQRSEQVKAQTGIEVIGAEVTRTADVLSMLTSSVREVQNNSRRATATTSEILERIAESSRPSATGDV